MKIRSHFSSFREKMQIFFLGLLFGIVLGGGFFLLKLDQYVKELSFYKSLAGKDDKDNLLPADTKPLVVHPKTQKTRKEKHTDVGDSTTQTHLVQQDSGSSVILSQQAGGDDIVVKKDEFLGQKIFTLLLSKNNPDTTANNQPIKEDNSRLVTIEFWQSPLNYRGYKFSRNRVILFGFRQEDIISLSRLDNSVFIKSAQGVFRIETCTDFRQPERITDETLLARIP